MERTQEENEKYSLNTFRLYWFAVSVNGLDIFLSFRELHIYICYPQTYTQNQLKLHYWIEGFMHVTDEYNNYDHIIAEIKNASGTRKLYLSRYYLLSLAILNKTVGVARKWLPRENGFLAAGARTHS